jgi:PAS domain S-box-containing protein
MVLAEFFIPHGHCYLWKPGLVGLHIVSDALIALAYYSIPLMLIYFVVRRRDIPFNWIFLLFGAFIISCGTGHLMEIWTLWHPNYWISGLLKAFTAIVSLYTAVELVLLFPQALAMPSATQFEAVKTEIHERQRAEAALLREKTHLAQAQKVAHVGSWEFDLATQEITWSDEIFRIYGLALGQPMPTITEHWQKIYPDDRRPWHAKIKQLFRGNYCELEFRIVRPDGSIRHLFAQGEPIFNPDGQVEKLFGTVLDISDRKQAEAALRESEARFRAAAEGSLDAFFIFQSLRDETERIVDFTFVDLNSRGEQMISLSKEEAIGKSMCEVLPSDCASAYFEKYVRVVETGVVLAEEFPISAPDVTTKWLHNQVVPLADGIALTSRDITPRKQAEAALRSLGQQEREKAQQLEHALKELQRTQTHLVHNEKMVSLGQLVAGVAHEINNPTSFIYGNIYPASQYAQDLLELLQLYQLYYPKPVAEITEYLECIDLDFIAKDFPKLLASMKEGANRIGEIVKSLRNFSRLDEMERKPVDIHEGIENTLLILQHRLTIQPKRSEIQVIKEYGELPPVECYPGQLNQVFMNIISNAIDALEESIVGRQRLARGEQSTDKPQETTENKPIIRIRTQVVEQNRVDIRIADNGSGITREIQSRIFDPFFTTKPPGKGTGLGLSISHQIVVDKHGGQFRCHSVPGQGTEFVIQLPIALHLQTGAIAPVCKIPSIAWC